MRNPLLFIPLTLVLTQAVPAASLLVNGDFSQGNTGFTSQYTYSPDSLMAAGAYAVTTNPEPLNPFGASFGDHTTGTGDMLAVNGAPSASNYVWSETISVTPNTDYVFTGWVASWTANIDPSPAVLSLTADGVALGGTFSPLAQAGQWVEFLRTWNSGNSTSVTLSIYDQNTVALGNDFALDDLSFAAVVPEPASIALLGTGFLVVAALRRKARRLRRGA